MNDSRIGPSKEDKELADVLSTISKVATRIATRLRMKGGKNGNQN